MKFSIFIASAVTFSLSSEAVTIGSSYSELLPISVQDREKSSSMAPPHPTLQVSKSGYPKSRKIRIRQTSCKLSNLFALLKTVTDGEVFDFSAFDAHDEEISQQIGKKERAMDTIVPVSESLLTQFRFSKEIYLAMLTFSNFSDSSERADSIADRLLYYINELGVLLYGLYGSHGSPDTEIKDYAQRVAAHVGRWNFLQREKDTYVEYSIASAILDVDFARVRRSLDVLEGDVTKNPGSVVPEMPSFDFFRKSGNRN